MKYLVFILALVSCGKDFPQHNESQTLNDLNIKRINPHSIEVEGINPVQGVVKIKTGWDEKKELEFEFSSLSDLKNHFTSLLTINSKFLPQNNSYDERMKIFFKNYSNEIETLTLEKEYNLTLHFSNLLKDRKKLIYINDLGEKDLGFIDFDTHLTLSGEEIKDLFQHKAFLIVLDSKQGMKEIKENHYRVYLSSDKSHVYYVSYAINFEDFLLQNNIDYARNIDEINLMTTKEFKSLKGWWFRELPGGDYVLVYQDIVEIHDFFFNKLFKVPFDLKRKEGKGSQTSIVADTQSRILLKFSGSKTMRQINISSRARNYFGHECFTYEKYVSEENKIDFKLEDLNQLYFNQAEVIQLERSQKNSELELLFQSKLSNLSLTIGLPNLNDKVVIGSYALKCDDEVQAAPATSNKISPEKLFEVKGEAFVERRHLSF